MSCRGIQLIFFLMLAGANFSFAWKYKSTPLSYNKYRLYEVIVGNNLNDNSYLSKKVLALQKESDSIILMDNVWWGGKTAHVIVAPHKTVDFEKALGRFGLNWNVLSDDYKYYVSSDAKQVDSVDNTYDWYSYYKLNSTYNFLHRLQRQNPGIVQPFVIGQSTEGRPIYVVYVSKPDKDREKRSAVKPVPDLWHGPATAARVNELQSLIETITVTKKKEKLKPTIFIEAGMHGNTWITSAVATYIINELATSEEPAISMVAKKCKWLILPHANPDGYVYTDTSDPLWSRTRGRHGPCIGVDPNRNFDVNWQQSNETNVKCNKQYRGPRPFSEPETKALADTLLAARKSTRLYISLHFGGKMTEMSGIRKFGLMNTFPYSEGNGSVVSDTYNQGGSSVEWASAKAGIKNAFSLNVGLKSLAGKGIIPGTQVAEGGIIEIAKDTLYTIVELAATTLSIDIGGPIVGYFM